MNMIGHNHVAPNSNIKFALRAMSVLPKSKLGAIHRGNTSAVASRKSDEVEWLIDVNQIKSMRTVLDHSSNCSRQPCWRQQFGFRRRHACKQLGWIPQAT